MFRLCDQLVRGNRWGVFGVERPMAVVRVVRVRSWAIALVALVLASSCGSSGDQGRSSAPDDAAGAAVRVLADERGIGAGAAAIVVIEDRAALTSWWSAADAAGSPPSFDPERELVLAITTTYPSGCEFPFLSLQIDAEGRRIEAMYGGNEPAECAADENPYSVVAAIDRTRLRSGTWTVTSSESTASAAFTLP